MGKGVRKFAVRGFLQLGAVGFARNLGPSREERWSALVVASAGGCVLRLEVLRYGVGGWEARIALAGVGPCQGQSGLLKLEDMCGWFCFGGDK
jgi:hypothetical protein